ncbi:ergothioneine biosynthesis protein EgtB [Dyella sedimenti]|uniref:ergothioneine biosynthesis protein EgtB n=1 Tax=Dyella sedimenti TaxID=2919947 RepID=UPI001FAA2DF6|nr:ergothioneine biosynthesis protein EgtB [Dyella sedimenti]
MNALRNDAPARTRMLEHYGQVRAATLHRASPLSEEDQAVQSMPEASPTKWHLGHTTWFAEKFVLQPFAAAYRAVDRRYDAIFNSYYDALGARVARADRGLLSRPSLAEVLDYRRIVDEAVLALLDEVSDARWPALERALILALNHEEQHQELMLTDILHAFSRHPQLPAYGPAPRPYLAEEAAPMRWIGHAGGLATIGRRASGTSFAFDNESPPHKVYLQPFAVAHRLVTCGEFADFVADGGYEEPRHWLADGWRVVQSEGWKHPLYWIPRDDPRIEPAGHDWHVFGWSGAQPMQPSAPVTNVSFYEADAYARWRGSRLPTEFEWEAASSLRGMQQLIGYAWQWTRSSYDPYPGFRPWSGLAAEYNGKFMSGQMVLRGSSAATPLGHARPSYRNYFPPAARWQFAGIRLARVA